ncbi:MAG: glycosyltransferase family 39 protein [Actinomycetia bacterium]|nr:glycosyltransferase family 39 protein [Actinomycetes bacterium]
MTPKKVALVLLLMVSFLLMNYTNLRTENWVLHPDDYEAFVIGHNLKETGRLSVDVPLNDMFEYPLFTPSGATYSGGKVVPTRAYGFYFICALGFFLGEHGPFYLIPLLGLICILFLYKLVSLVMDEKKALLAAFLFALSAPFLYWNNMLFSNIPALAFLMIGLYFLVKIAYGDDGRLRWYLLCAVFFALATWVRYEQLIIILPFFLIVVLKRRSFKLKYTVVAVVLLILLLSPILLLNNSLHGNPFGTGYTESYFLQEKTGPSEGGSGKGTSKSIGSLLDRFFVNYLRPDPSKIYNNAYTFIFKPFSVLVLAGILGLLLMIADGAPGRSFALTLLIVVLFWGYYVCNSTLWFIGDAVVASSYTRYLLIVYAVLAMAAPVLIERVGKVVGPNGYRALVAFFIIAFLITQVGSLMSGSLNLRATSEEKAGSRLVNEIAGGLPENTVIFAPYYSKVIAGGNVIHPGSIEGEDNIDITNKLVNHFKELMEEGYQIYIMEASWHRSSYWNLVDFLRRKEHLPVEEIRSFATCHGSDMLYRIIPTPIIASISQDRGPVGIEVTIKGTGFRGRYALDSYVSFGASRAINCQLWSETEVKCNVPPGAEGTVRVTVTTAGGTSEAARFTVEE